jgi:pilus assembly protein CpaE
MLDKIRVLIVDDHHEMRETLYHMLQAQADMEAVGVAATGIQALDQARLLKPDIVLMDVNLPGIDGVAASQTILRAVPETKIVMISSHDAADVKWGSMMVGAKEFLTKPFSLTQLVNCIRAVHRG